MKKRTHAVLYTILFVNAFLSWWAWFEMSCHTVAHIDTIALVKHELVELIYKVDDVIMEKPVSPTFSPGVRAALDELRSRGDDK